MKFLTVALLLLAGAIPPGGGRGADPTQVIQAGPMEVSKKSVENTVNHETGGYAYFQKYYQRPQDPGYSSGVTVGFGYDLKFHTPSQIRKDWAGVASTSEIDAMCSVSGKDGSVYRQIRNKVHITWDEGLIVFNKVTLPRWGKTTYDAYRLKGLVIHPDLGGALLGNTFNRGPGMSGSRAVEKRMRRDYIARHEWDKVPGTFLAEQRWWPGHSGLQRRRRDEAGFASEALKYDWWQK